MANSYLDGANRALLGVYGTPADTQVPAWAAASSRAAWANQSGSGAGGGTTLNAGTVFIAEYTGASVASLDLASRNKAGFTGNLFQADFDRYIVQVLQCRGVTDATNLRVRVITGGSADSSALYTYTTLASVAGGIGGGGGGDTTLVTGIDFPGNTTVAGCSISPIFEVVNPLGSLHKQISSLNVHKGRVSTGDARRIGFWSHGLYESSNVVTGLQLLMSSGNIESITVRVYAVNNSGIGAAGAGGGLVFLERKVASNSAQLDFTSFISSAYDKYLIVGEGLVLQTNAASLGVQFGSSTGPTWDTGATNKYEWGSTGIATSSAGVNDSGATGMNRLFNSVSNSAGYGFCAFQLTATQLQSTSLRKHLHGYGVYTNSSPLQLVQLKLVTWVDTATPCTGLRFIPSSGNIVSGSISIYGITNTAGSSAGSTPVLLQELTASASASLDLTGVIGTAWDKYELHLDDIVLSATTILGIKGSTDGGATWLGGTNYDTSYGYVYGGGSGGGAVNNAARIPFRDVTTTNSATAAYQARLMIGNPLGAVLHKLVYGDVYLPDNSIGYLNIKLMGRIKTTSPINALQVIPDTGTITSGKVRLFGWPKR